MLRKKTHKTSTDDDTTTKNIKSTWVGWILVIKGAVHFYTSLHKAESLNTPILPSLISFFPQSLQKKI